MIGGGGEDNGKSEWEGEEKVVGMENNGLLHRKWESEEGKSRVREWLW
jgi:hypothetical protein